MNLRIAFALAALLSAPVAIARLAEPAATSRPGRGLDAATPDAPASPLVTTGPDVIVGDLTGSAGNNSMGGPLIWSSSGEVRAYSIGTTSCNIGDEPLDWYDFGTPTPTAHPVIAQNLYRLKDGRFEQIGMSWVKHAFCAVQQTLCGVCDPVGPGCEDQLGVGCSDPYGATINGDQARLGPRSEINAATGQILVWPHSTPGTSSALLGRVQVRETDLDPALNPGARYFAEGHYVAEDDAGAGQDNNNASYREVQVTGANYALPYIGAIQRMKPAIRAWQDIDPEVIIENVDVPGDGRFMLACRASDNGDGTWHYEYALYNLCSDRSAGQFIVPAASCVNVTGVGFHDIDHHSGEPYATADWIDTRAADSISWATDSFLVDPNANALRWGTLFNYRFDADTPPTSGEVTVSLFKPGSPGAMNVAALVPQVGGPAAAADCADGGDGTVDILDLLALLAEWGDGGACDIAPDGGDGAVGINDLLQLLSWWGEVTCP